MKPSPEPTSDICNERDIEVLIDRFYDKVLKDEQLAPIFLDVAKIDIDHHKGHIRRYWEKLLLKKPGYNRHTMNIHRAISDKTSIKVEHFERWLALFRLNVDECYQGPVAENAKLVALHIAGNMERDMVK